MVKEKSEIPETVKGLNLYIILIEKEIKKLNGKLKIAFEKLEVINGKPSQ